MSGAVKAAVGGALAAAVAEARGADPEQLDLVGVPAVDETGWSAERAGNVRVRAAAGRRGRPKGATNLANRDVKAFVRQVFNYDPLIEAVRWAQHTPETLAEVLGCTRLEAFDRLDRLHARLQPLFYAAQAPVDEDGKPVPTFAVQIGQATIGAASSRPPWEYAGGPVIDVQQNQPLSAPTDPQSHGAQSHEADK